MVQAQLMSSPTLRDLADLAWSETVRCTTAFLRWVLQGLIDLLRSFPTEPEVEPEVIQISPPLAIVGPTPETEVPYTAPTEPATGASNARGRAALGDTSVPNYAASIAAWPECNRRTRHQS